MRILVFDHDRCTGCHVCEESCSETWFKETDRAKSAIRILEPDTPEGVYQAIVCNQCGDCIDICPTKAILRNKRGVVVIQKKLCVGCLACVSFCDTWAMRTHPDHTEPFKCVPCGQCVKVCSENALSIQQVADVEPSETIKWAERVVAK